MPTNHTSSMLSVIKEFQNLSPKELDMAADVCHWHRYESGEDIVRYHDNSNSVFFIIQGEIRVTITHYLVTKLFYVTYLLVNYLAN